MSTEIKIMRLPSMRDAAEYSIEVEFNGQHYIAYVDITGQRVAFSKQSMSELLDKAVQQFVDLVKMGKISPKDRPKFGFWAKGDFILNQDKKYLKLNAPVSKSSGDRLHIEIPKSYRHLFEEGDSIKLIKDELGWKRKTK